MREWSLISRGYEVALDQQSTWISRLIFLVEHNVDMIRIPVEITVKCVSDILKFYTPSVVEVHPVKTMNS